MCLIHIRLNLEYKRGKTVFHRIHRLAVTHSCHRRKCHLQECLKENLHTEVLQCRSEEDRCQLSRTDPVQIKFSRRAVQKVNLPGQLLIGVLTDLPDDRVLVIQGNLHLTALFGSLLRVKILHHLVGFPVINSLKFLTGSNRPVHRAGLHAKVLLDIIQKIKGILRIPVHLIDKGKNRHVTHSADLKELLRLRLDTLGAVDYHDGGIRCHQRPVGILREILMSRRIQNVDAAAIIFKLKNGRGDRNSSLLLNFHPVGNRCLSRCLSLDRARLVDGSAVEKEFLRQRCFTGVRVGNDGEGPAASDFFCNCSHFSKPF
ncbi:putative uncharacterized protein [Firmicutes bacterium CAG:791]|nr:putative uncharacterized protein [Firmicutes bacterium CAG:791]